MTLRRYVDTALFDVLLEISERLSISICKLRYYLDCVTSKGKGPWILDVSATLASQTRVTLQLRTVYFCSAWICLLRQQRYYLMLTQAGH